MRQFETDYAGSWRGFCKTREGAIIAAMKHIVKDGYTKCTITNRHTLDVVARVRISSDRKRAIVETYEPMEAINEDVLKPLILRRLQRLQRLERL